MFQVGVKAQCGCWTLEYGGGGGGCLSKSRPKRLGARSRLRNN